MPACDEILAVGTWSEFLRFADQSGADYNSLPLATLAELLRRSAARAYRKHYHSAERRERGYVVVG